MPFNGIWLDSRLKDISVESKKAQIGVRTKKLWPIEVWYQLWKQLCEIFFSAVAKFFSQGLPNLHSLIFFFFLFLFFHV